MATPLASEEINRRIGRSSAGLMALHLANYGARFLKGILIALFFGTLAEYECYTAALNLPLVVNGVLHGALVTAVVPILVDLRARAGPEAADRLWTRFGLVVFAALLLLCTGLGLAAPRVVAWITDPARHDVALTAYLLRVLLGYLALYFLVQYATLVFHSHHQFVYPMAMTLPNLAVNLAVIVLWFSLVRVEAVGLAWGLYAGAAVQLALMVRRGWRRRVLRPAWGPAPDLGRAARNSALLLLSSLLSPATLITVDIIMAREIPKGIATLNYAYTMFMFPVTVGIMNLGYVLLPYLSTQVVQRDWAGLGHTVSVTVRVLVFVTVPVAAGLWLVSDDLVATLLQRGRFTAEDTQLVGATLRAYVWGLLFAGLWTVQTKILNALQRVRAIFAVSALAFAVKIAANAVLSGPLGAAGIALATALFYGLSWALLEIWVRRTVPLHLEVNLWPRCGAMLAGGALLVVAVLGLRAALAPLSPPAPVRLALEVAVGGAVWLGWCAALRMPELGMIWRTSVRACGRARVEP